MRLALMAIHSLIHHLTSSLSLVVLSMFVSSRVQSLAMGITFFIVFKSKDRNSDTAFDY